MSTYKSFDTEDNEAVSLASIGDIIKVTVLDEEGYYQSTYMNHKTAKEVRDYLSQLLHESRHTQLKCEYLGDFSKEVLIND